MEVGTVPKMKVEIEEWRARYLRRREIEEVEGKVLKKKMELGDGGHGT